MTIREQALSAKKAQRDLSLLSSGKKNKILRAIQKELQLHEAEILKANENDVHQAEVAKMGAMIDRVRLSKERLKGIQDSLDIVIALPDPIGDSIDERVRPNGLHIERVRAPLGVVGMIYEARPNVTVDAAVLCLKSGNAVILKGGSAALHSNRALVNVIHTALKKSDFSPDLVQFIDDDSHDAVKELLSCEGLVECIIPRGGKKLIDFVRKNSLIPVIETGASVVHAYIDKDADLKKAVAITVNAKTRRCAICNTLDVLLVHESILKKFLPMLGETLGKRAAESGTPSVEVRAEKKIMNHLKNYSKCKEAQTSDFDTEFLDYVLAVKSVGSLDQALEHIAIHSLKHSEAIVTENQKTAERFLKEVDAACVYHNASTQFSDGGEFGLGAEIGISTQKLHVRGPFALEGLTTYKWVVRGEGQTRV